VFQYQFINLNAIHLAVLTFVRRMSSWDTFRILQGRVGQFGQWGMFVLSIGLVTFVLRCTIL